MSKHQLTELATGERVISERVPGVRSVALGFWIGAGSRDEPDARGGRLALHRAPALQGLGALLGAGDRRDLRRARRRAERRHLARDDRRLRTRSPTTGSRRALDVMADMVFRPAFVDVDSEREVVLEEIAMVEDTPNDLVHDIAAEAVFGSASAREARDRAAPTVISTRVAAGARRRTTVARTSPSRSSSLPPATSDHDGARVAARGATRTALRRGRVCAARKPARVEKPPTAPLPAQGHRAVPRLPRARPASHARTSALQPDVVRCRCLAAGEVRARKRSGGGERRDERVVVERVDEDAAAGVTNSGGPHMAFKRDHHTATLLPDGRVLVVGGAFGAPPAELYDPAAGVWTMTGSPVMARSYHTSTLLPNGKVLVVAGPGVSAELYDPANGTWTETGSLVIHAPTATRRRCSQMAKY